MALNSREKSANKRNKKSKPMDKPVNKEALKRIKEAKANAEGSKKVKTKTNKKSVKSRKKDEYLKEEYYDEKYYEDEYYEDEYEDEYYEYDEAYEDEYADDSYADGSYDDRYSDSYDDEYYDEDYYDDDYVDDDYVDDEYIDDGYADDDYHEDEESGFAAIKRQILDWMADRTTMDYILIGGGIVALIAVIIAGSIVLSPKKFNKASSLEFAKLGSELEGVVVGEQGVESVIEAHSLLEETSEENAEEIVEENAQTESANKTESKATVSVVMSLTSIQRDLKIKFLDNDSKGLIKGVPFEVVITDPSGKKLTKTNGDKDGVIYLSGITPGNYQVALNGPDDEKYKFLKDPVSIAVKDVIEYKKVDITNEIKKESEVNVAKEDTAKNDTVVESSNKDTVEWVESTKTLIEGTGNGDTNVTYKPVEKTDISDPSKTAFLNVKLLSKRYDETPSPEGGEGNTESSEPSSADTPSDAPAAESSPSEEPSAEPTPSAKPSEEVSPSPESTPTPSTTPTPTPTPTVSPSNEPSPSPSATSSVSPSVSPSTSVSPSASASPSPDSPEVEKAKKDTSSTLKTTKGETVYVNDNGSFREAKFADYYKFDKFYLQDKKVEGGEYKYTGWQTLDGYTYFFDKNGKPVTGEQVIQGAKYTFDSEGRMNTGSGVLGIDVSKWNGNINWTEVKNSGVNFVIIRCGFRGSSAGGLVEDAKFASNIQGAKNAGLKVGVYFFTQAINEVEAVEEASMAISLCNGYNLSYPIYIDVESSGGRADKLSADERTAVVKAFCKTVSNSGYKAGVYANKTWFDTKMNTGELSGYKIWLAQYAATPTYTRTKYDMWQYSSKGTVGGISGNVDMNISYLGY